MLNLQNLMRKAAISHEHGLDNFPTSIPPTLHKNHPSSIWCRETKENYLWLYELAENLCAEYTFRTGKVHKTAEKIEMLKTPPTLPFGQLTKFALAMPEEYKSEDPVESYRNYYRNEKVFMKNGKRMDTWTRRERPSWFDIAKK